MRLEADEALWFRMRSTSRQRWPVMLVHRQHDRLVDGADPGERLEGLTCYASRCIYVDASLSLARIHETTLHEMVHATFYDTLPSHLLLSKYAADLEEVMIRQFTPVMMRHAKVRLPAFPPEAVAVIRSARRAQRVAA